MPQSSRQPRRHDGPTESLRGVAVRHLIVSFGGETTVAGLRDEIRSSFGSTLDHGGYKRALGQDLIDGRLELDGVGDDAVVRVAERGRWKR